MRMICAWCGQLIVDEPHPPTSHGICPKCADILRAERGSDSLEQARRQLAALHPSQDPRD